MLNFFLKRRIKRRIKHVKFDIIENESGLSRYKNHSGEYFALKYLRDFSTGKSIIHPHRKMEHCLKSIYNALYDGKGWGVSDSPEMIHFWTLATETILRYIK